MVAERIDYGLRPDELRRDLSLSRERMARLVDVSAKTVERWERQQALPARAHGRVRTQLAQIQAVRDLGLCVYTPEGFRQFLRTPLPAFGGRTPLQMIEQGHTDDVVAALASDYEGLGYQMTLAGHLKRWSGAALRHIPAGSSFDVLDFRYAGRGSDNRWNEPGSPTLYLAGAEGVLIAEWGRHFATHRTAQLQQLTVERSVYRMELALEFVLDLRGDDVCRVLSLDNAPSCFLDRDVARATAHFVRRTTDAQALLVPTMGFLDDPDRWCLAVFLEKLPPDPHAFIASATPCGALRWEQDRPSAP